MKKFYLNNLYLIYEQNMNKNKLNLFLFKVNNLQKIVKHYQLLDPY